MKAFIVLTEQYKQLDKETLIRDIQNHVKSVTAPYKYPRKVSSPFCPSFVSDSFEEMECHSHLA